jgi:MFS family permease
MAALGLAGLLNLVLTTTGIVLLPLSQDGWGQAESGFGTATAFLGFGALAAPLLCRVVTATTGRGLAALTVALLLVAGTPVPWVALPLLGLAGACAVAVESLVTGTLQRVVPDRHRAGALGLADAVMVGACLVGSLVGPHLAGLTGARPAMVLVASLCLAPFAMAAVAGLRRTPSVALAVPLVAEERLAA